MQQSDCSLETPAERIERKKREEELRKEKRRQERLWRSLLAHAIGIIYILAELNLDYKPDLRHNTDKS